MFLIEFPIVADAMKSEAAVKILPILHDIFQCVIGFVAVQKHLPHCLFTRFHIHLMIRIQDNIRRTVRQLVHELLQIFRHNPIIGINHLQITASCLCRSCIDCRSVPAVFLGYQAKYLRILLHIASCNLRRLIVRAIINDNHFNLFQHLRIQEGLKADIQIFLHII